LLIDYLDSLSRSRHIPAMPLYEYECEKCHKTFEVSQSIKDKPLRTYPHGKCTGKIHRIISGGAGFILKGSGFYKTDYRSDSYKSAAKKEKESAAPKSESKGSCGNGGCGSC
jgi:putative FmdB family regulatory protein